MGRYRDTADYVINSGLFYRSFCSLRYNFGLETKKAKKVRINYVFMSIINIILL